MFVCLLLFTNVVVVAIFLFPTFDCLNAKGEENLPQTAQRNSCMTLHRTWHIYLSQKI